MDKTSMAEILQLYMMQNLSKINSDETQSSDNSSSDLFTSLLQDIIKNTNGDPAQSSIVQQTPVGTNLDGDSDNSNNNNSAINSTSLNSVSQDVNSNGNSSSNSISNIDSAIAQAAQKYGVDGAFIKAIVKQESGFHPNAVSKAGAIGLMQLMPQTADSLGVRNPFDVLENIDGGTKYIKKLVDSFGGNKELALAAYNGGIGRMNKRGVDTVQEIDLMPKETQDYVAKVMKNYEDNKKV